MIGTPLRVDEATATLTRPSVARVCVEIDLQQTLEKEIDIRFNEVLWIQRVEYERLPKYCMHCKHLGHGIKECYATNPNLKEAARVPSTHELRAGNQQTGCMEDLRNLLDRKKAKEVGGNAHENLHPPLKPTVHMDVAEEITKHEKTSFEAVVKKGQAEKECTYNQNKQMRVEDIEHGFGTSMADNHNFGNEGNDVAAENMANLHALPHTTDGKPLEMGSNFEIQDDARKYSTPSGPQKEATTNGKNKGMENAAMHGNPTVEHAKLGISRSGSSNKVIYFSNVNMQADNSGHEAQQRMEAMERVDDSLGNTDGINLDFEVSHHEDIAVREHAVNIPTTELEMDVDLCALNTAELELEMNVGACAFNTIVEGFKYSENNSEIPPDHAVDQVTEFVSNLGRSSRFNTSDLGLQNTLHADISRSNSKNLSDSDDIDTVSAHDPDDTFDEARELAIHRHSTSLGEEDFQEVTSKRSRKKHEKTRTIQTRRSAKMAATGPSSRTVSQ